MSGKLASVVVLAALTAHAAMTLIYLAPANMLKVRVGAVVNAYMKPLFAQDWHLFAPNPGFTSTRLWVRCQVGTDWQEWTEPMEKVQRAHESNRATGRGKVLYVYHGIASLLATEAATAARLCDLRAGKRCDDGAVEDVLAPTERYKLARRYAEAVCKLRHGDGAFAATQFKLVTLYPKRFSERDRPERYGRVELNEFRAAPVAREEGA